VLDSISTLFGELDNHHVRWVHWKSNQRLDDVLRGETDIDLLVDRRHVGGFESVLAALKFRRGTRPTWEEEPSIFHFFGLDAATGRFVHVHAYYRIFSGGALLKNFHLPVEELLLANSRRSDGVPIPTAAADCVVLVLRKLLEHTTLCEFALVRRELAAVREELRWLLDDCDEASCVALASDTLPAVEPELFRESLHALLGPSSVLRRVHLGMLLRRRIASSARHGAVVARAIAYSRFGRKLIRRLRGARSKQRLANGGSVVAVVGPEATGKSTLGKALGEWLGEHFRVRSVHAGKPPHGWLTILPGVLLPALRRALPRFRSGDVETDLEARSAASNPRSVRGLRLRVFVARSVMLAVDRARLLVRAHREASNGTIVLCDRYPTATVGAMDSPQVREDTLPASRLSLCRFLGRKEAELYQRLPRADIILQLGIDVDRAVERNASRVKKGNEGEAYVRRRHAQARDLTYECANLVRIDTDRPFEETLREAQRAIWNAL